MIALRRAAAGRQPVLSELSRRRKLALVARQLRPRSRVLEIGSGDGWFTRRLRERGHDVISVDLAGGGADVVGDVREWRALGLPEAAFDVVIALELIEHVDCIADLVELCKPGGLVVLSSPHPRWDWLMAVLERLGLSQPRTSAHCNLTDFARLPRDRLAAVVLRRPLGIHQFGIFRRVGSWEPKAGSERCARGS